MTRRIETNLALRDRYLPFLDRLARLFRQMDQAYAAVADQYGFLCQGCKDNCCLTRFHHHTLIEYLYLMEGFRALDTDSRQAVRKQASSVNARMAEADRRGEALRTMCPLNRNGSCRTYANRPMICRLHGIPHELHRPNGEVQTHPGCDAFLDQCRESGRTHYIPFDRTPFYREMAMLESALRMEMKHTGKIKLTIAQMLETITDDVNEID